MSGAVSYAPEDFYVDVPEWKRTRGAIFGEFKNLTENLARLRIDISQERNTKLMENHVNPSTDTSKAPSINSYADNTLDTSSLNAQTDWIIGDNHYLITGYEFSYDDLDALSETYLDLSSILPIMSQPVLSKDQSFSGYQMRHSVFANMESTLFEDWVFNYGVRYTWVKNDMDVNTRH